MEYYNEVLTEKCNVQNYHAYQIQRHCSRFRASNQSYRPRKANRMGAAFGHMQGPGTGYPQISLGMYVEAGIGRIVYVGLFGLSGEAQSRCFRTIMYMHDT